MEPGMALVLREEKEGVAVLTLNRPEHLNAMNPQLFVELRAHIDAIAGNTDGVGCVILTGAGKSFSAGNDLRAIAARERAPTPHFQAETIDALEALPQPTICAVRGHCYTGGMELMLGCDFLIASDTSRFCDTHGKFGMTPLWGLTQRLPRRVGLMRAKEISLTGRVIAGEEAARIGLAIMCVPDAELESRAMAFARMIVGNSWHSARGNKLLYQQSQQRDLASGLSYERNKGPGVAPDMAERVANFGRK
jgi:enoyl-CoA hydratase